MFSLLFSSLSADKELARRSVGSVDFGVTVGAAAVDDLVAVSGRLTRRALEDARREPFAVRELVVALLAKPRLARLQQLRVEGAVRFVAGVAVLLHRLVGPQEGTAP